MQQGGEVQKFAIRRTGETFQDLRGRYLAKNPAKGQGDVTFIGHQANLRMLESVQRRCEVPDARHKYNVDRRGNTGSAGAPGVLSEHWDDTSLGDTVVLSVVGSGLTWAGALLERTVAMKP
jgi:3-oxoacyl-[acyl-carrier-protein] synthase-3